MALIDDVKTVCDRLAPQGWRDLVLAVTNNALDILQSTNAKLKSALTTALPEIDRTKQGFEDFHPAGARGITPRSPARSLLYHALASPRVVRGAGGAVLGDFPTLREIETIENYIFGIEPKTLADVVADSGAAKLMVAVFATEYRSAPDTPNAAHSDLVFSRTGIARVGTARSKYLPEVRGFRSEDENNPHAFRTIPVRFTVWLASPTKGIDARVMRTEDPDAAELARRFWIPVHKLFGGKECLSGLDLSLDVSGQFFNLKLQRVMKSLGITPLPTSFPFVITDNLATVERDSDFGSISVEPLPKERLVEPAMANGQRLTFKVPTGKASGFATYATDFPTRDGVEIHRFPAYVHARSRVESTGIINLNDDPNVNAHVDAGNYDAQLFVDFTGEGWVDVQIPQLATQTGVQTGTRPAYVLLSAPDFFPSAGQRELTRWSNSSAIPASFRGGQIWGVPPEPLSNIRFPANLQLPDSPFDIKEDTITAVVQAGSSLPPAPFAFADVRRASNLPDDAAGVFAPGWDVAVDVKGNINTGPMHLAAYGLGSPFPEDAKLCAALSTFWPAVSPDVYRTMSLHTGNPNLRGTVAPLTDEEIGQVGNLPWDGVSGPKVVTDGPNRFVEMASFLNTDYVTNAVENRFSIRLLSQITSEEFQARVLAAARTHWILSGGVNVRPARTKWLLISFRSVSSGEPELQVAQSQAGHVLQGQAYRVEACFIGDGSSTQASPLGARFRRIPLQQLNLLFVTADDRLALRRREDEPTWSAVVAE